jgi:ABC-type glycerol-3-phosphate transport system substrate-binding protein
MKKIFLFFIFALCLMPVFSQTITFMSTDTKMIFTMGEMKGKSFYYDYALPKLLKDFPSAKVELLQVDLSTGATLSLDAMLAAGTPPNVYCDTLVRSSKLIDSDYALPLDTYIRDLSKYNPGVLDAYKRKGKVLAVPISGAPQGMCINMDMMAEIGYVVPDRWTIEDFLTMAEKVKKFYSGKRFATGMFAANQSGDYLINNWFAAFGAKFYNPGDYSHTVIKETGGVKAYDFFQKLVKSGYIPSGAAMLNDDDYAAAWAKGELAATAFYVGWQKPYWDTAIQQKFITKPFEVKYVPFPRYVGVENVPTYMMNAAYVVHKTGTEKDKIAARLVEYLNDGFVQSQMSLMWTLPNRVDAKSLLDDTGMNQILGIVKAGGMFDVGLTYNRFSATRPTHYPILQKVLNLTITPEAAIAEYEKALNEVLKE